MGKMVATLEDFEKELAAAGDKLVVVDFTATWCGPCKMIAPKFEEYSKDYSDCVFLKVDVDDNSATAEKYEISAMPTFKFFKTKAAIDTFSGANADTLKERIEKHK